MQPLKYTTVDIRNTCFNSGKEQNTDLPIMVHLNYIKNVS